MTPSADGPPPAPASAAPAALALTGVTQTFGAVRALDAVDFTLRAGTVHALLGENGAGKTTLMRVAFGMLAPDAGTVRIGGTIPRLDSPADALAAGVGMVHQHFSLVPAMSVAENVALGGHGAFDPAAAAETVRTITARTGLALDPSARVGDLPVGAQQRCEIVKALARDVRVLILDEPTAVLAPSEARDLLRWARRYADEGGAVVLITHKLRDALAVADDVTVLRRGRVVYAGPCADATEATLATAMIGETPRRAGARDGAAERGAGAAGADDARTARGAADNDHAHATRGGAVFTADALTLTDARGVPVVDDATFTMHAGELVGIAAVEGQGQHELLRALAGLQTPSRGTLSRTAPDGGAPVPPRAVAFVPEDRHRDALLLDATLTENVALRDVGAASGRLPWRVLRERTADLVAAHDVRAGAPDVPARALSGGNQQKLIIGRALDAKPPAAPPVALVAENPTRGLDFHATAAVHDALRDARARGLAVVLYSSDLDEVLALADRVFALHGGTMREVENEREVVGRAMLGAAAT